MANNGEVRFSDHIFPRPKRLAALSHADQARWIHFHPLCIIGVLFAALMCVPLGLFAIVEHLPKEIVDSRCGCSCPVIAHGWPETVMTLVIALPCLAGIGWSIFNGIALQRYLRLLTLQEWLTPPDIPLLLDVATSVSISKGTGVDFRAWILRNLAGALEISTAADYASMPPQNRRHLARFFQSPYCSTYCDPFDSNYQRILQRLVTFYRETDSIEMRPALRGALRSLKRMLRFNVALRSEIEACIEYLDARAGDISRTTLLRSADRPTDGLLRAASGVRADAPAAELVRPSEWKSPPGQAGE